MKTICAWCGKVLAHSTRGRIETSHGICPECDKKVLSEFQAKQLEEWKKKHLTNER